MFFYLECFLFSISLQQLTCIIIHIYHLHKSRWKETVVLKKKLHRDQDCNSKSESRSSWRWWLWGGELLKSFMLSPFVWELGQRPVWVGESGKRAGSTLGWELTPLSWVVTHPKSFLTSSLEGWAHPSSVLSRFSLRGEEWPWRKCHSRLDSWFCIPFGSFFTVLGLPDKIQDAQLNVNFWYESFFSINRSEIFHPLYNSPKFKSLFWWNGLLGKKGGSCISTIIVPKPWLPLFTSFPSSQPLPSSFRTSQTQSYIASLRVCSFRVYPLQKSSWGKSDPVTPLGAFSQLTPLTGSPFLWVILPLLGCQLPGLSVPRFSIWLQDFQLLPESLLHESSLLAALSISQDWALFKRNRPG